MTQKQNRIAEIAICFAAIIMSCILSVFAQLRTTAELDAHSEDNMKEALKIVSSAGEKGLTERELADLSALGLSYEQIEMLEQLILTDNSVPEPVSDNTWQAQKKLWTVPPVWYLILIGLVIAGAAVSVWVVFRKAFPQKKKGREKRNAFQKKEAERGEG